MLSEARVREHVEESLVWLEKFATKDLTNIFKNDLIEVDRTVTRLSTLLEVLMESPSKETLEMMEVLMNKIQKV